MTQPNATLLRQASPEIPQRLSGISELVRQNLGFFSYPHPPHAIARLLARDKLGKAERSIPYRDYARLHGDPLHESRGHTEDKDFLLLGAKAFWPSSMGIG
jgi:hypothetical protein